MTWFSQLGSTVRFPKLRSLVVEINHMPPAVLLKVAEFTNIAELLLTLSENDIESQTFTLDASVVKQFAQIRLQVGLPLKLVLYGNEKFSMDRQPFDANVTVLNKAKVHVKFADESFDEFDFEQWFVRPH